MKSRIFLGKAMTCGELRAALDTQRGPDGIARKVLIRRCLITECPGPDMNTILSLYLKIEDSRIVKSVFTHKTFAQLRTDPLSEVDINNYSR